MAEGGSSTSFGTEGVANFLKLRNLFGASTSQIYRSHFVSLWNNYFGASSGEWQNTKDFVEKKFISGGIGKQIYDSCDEHQRRILRAGNISLWDLSLLLDVIKKLQNAVKNLTPETPDGEIKFLSEEKMDETKILWEEVDYQSRIIVDYENYGNWMAKVIKALEENGISKDKIFTTAFFLEEPAELASELDDVGKLAEKSKEDGNLAAGKNEFEKAFKFYTDAIELDGLPDELLGALYCDRSLCNIHLNRLEDAKFDAKCAVTLRPSWFKGYLRLGKIFEEMDEFNQALQFYKLAEMLEPGSKKVAAATKSCKSKMDAHQFKCTSTTQGFRNILSMEKQRLYRNPQNIAHHKELVRQEEPNALCREAGYYESGDWGYPQDYKRAADFYSRAAAKGHSAGVYHLAILTEKGEGVPKDVPKAFEMYKNVATISHSPDDPIPEGAEIGVVCMSQMRLGMFYYKGEIVPRDLEMGISWLKKSLENGCHVSALNLGLIYMSEEKWDMSLAILHFMMGSYMGSVEAMGQLANIFLALENPLFAQKWWKLAIHCGCMEMKKQENLFMKEELTPNFNPLHFRADIKRRLYVEFKDIMKNFENPKYFLVSKVWDAEFYKVDGIPEEEERELCKAMRNM